VLSRIRPLLQSSRFSALVALIAALLVAPSLFAGLATEDFAEREFITSSHEPVLAHVNLFGHDATWTPALTLFRNADYQTRGWFPWIADPSFDASFLRPLASLTHHLDYRLFPNHPMLMHAESILWYVALVVAVTAFHRRLLEPRWVASLSSLLYAIDDAHGQPVGWLINRSALMAALFSVLSLLAYDGFRRQGSRLGAFLTVVFVGLALASAEFGLCVAGYFVAYVIFVDEAPWRTRLAAATTWVVTIGAWAVVYATLGYGTHGSGLYLDPRADPVGYAFGFAERSAMLLLGQFGAPFSDLWAQENPFSQGLLVFFAASFTWFVGWALLPLLARDRRARFFGLGLILSLPPAAATFPEDRLLLMVGVGAFPLVAMTLADVSERARKAHTASTSSRALAWIFVAVHCVAAPLLLPYRTLRMLRFERSLERAADSARLASSHVPGEALIFVNATDFYFGAMVPATEKARGAPELPRVFTLSGTLERTEIRRSSLNVLEVRPKNGFLSRPFNRIHRNPAVPFHRGQTLDLRGVEVTVEEVDQWGAPLVASFSFALPLGNERYRFLTFEHGRYVPFSVPDVGESVFIGGA